MENVRGNFWFQIFKGVVNAVLIALLSVLAFALVLRFASLSDSVIRPVNQFIKLISIFLGCFVGVKGGKGFVKGLIIGLSVTVLTYLLFSLISGNISFDLYTVLDWVFGTLMGGISGIICMLIKKDRQ